VHVVGLAGELEQLALDVHAHGLHALFRPREVPVGEQVVPVGRLEHHVHVHAETAVATGAKAVLVLAKALTAAKRTPQRAWLAEVSAVVLQQALAVLSTTVVRENQLIAVEDLAVSGPARTRPARSVVSAA